MKAIITMEINDDFMQLLTALTGYTDPKALESYCMGMLPSNLHEMGEYANFVDTISVQVVE